MDPIEQFRLLRDDSRWVREELDFDAYAQPVRRRWSWPRIAGFSVVGAVVAVAAVLVAVSAHGSWNVAPVPAASGLEKVTQQSALPLCKAGQFTFGVEQYVPEEKPDGFVRAGWITAQNTSDTACRLDGHNEPSVQFAQADGAVTGGDGFSATNGSRNLSVRAGESFFVPFAVLSEADASGACRQTAAGFLLNMPGWTTSPFVSAETVYCGTVPQITNWPAAGTADRAELDQDLRETAYQSPGP